MRIATILGLFFASSALAQVEDTTSAWRYFPLEVGNVWEYESTFESCGPECGPSGVLGFWRWRAEQDSTLDGMSYFVIREERFTPEGDPEQDGRASFFVRFDTLSAHPVRRDASGADYPWPEAFPCRLDSPWGAEPACGYENVYGSYEAEVYVSDDLIVTTAKSFVSLANEVRFGADLGYLGMSGGKISVWEDRLTYARIGGVEHGVEQFPVATEVFAPSEVGRLAVYPKPARNMVTLVYAFERTQRATLAVYDVLGRRVLSRDLGVVSAGEQAHRLDLAALLPGLYVVHLSGDAGARTTARLVLQ